MVSYQHKVDIVDGNGTSLLTIKPTINGREVQYCTGICCDGSGIYIAVRNGVANTGHIHHYDDDGTFLSCIDQGLHNPRGNHIHCRWASAGSCRPSYQ